MSFSVVRDGRYLVINVGITKVFGRGVLTFCLAVLLLPLLKIQLFLEVIC